MSTDTLETPLTQSPESMSQESELSLQPPVNFNVPPRVLTVDSQGFYIQSKYFFDRVFGSLGLVFASPLIISLWAAVRLNSQGPGFYRQRRVGLFGETFYIVKLRTMRVDAEKNGPQWSSGSSDDRTTRLGKFLRKFHLDELPQLYNVARGEMSFVGPRPERPEIIAELEQRIPNYHLRHDVKPGITGLAQINLPPDKNINDTREKQILDLRYSQAASPWLDGRMIFATILRMCGLGGERVISVTGLKQSINDKERAAMDYEFDVPEDQLWSPAKMKKAEDQNVVASSDVGSLS